MEPSATLETNNPSLTDSALNVLGTNAISLNGLHLVCLTPGFSGLFLGGMPQPLIDMCVLEGIVCNACTEQCLLQACVVKNGIVDIEGSSFTPFTTLFLDVSGYTFDGGVELGNLFRRTVFDGNPVPLGPSSPAPFVLVGGVGSTTWSFGHCIVKNSVGDALHAFALTNWNLETVVIQGSGGDAILCEGSQMTLVDVTGGTGGLGDPANAGFGVHVNDGGLVRVTDSATLVTGTSGDIKVGTLAPRTWTDFRTTPPIRNEYDLTTPFVVASSGAAQPPGDELTGIGTGGRSGSRLFQR